MKAKVADGRTVNNTPGGCGHMAMPQKPIPGPERTGGPVSMQKALAKKPYRSKGTNSPGLVK